MADDPPDLSRKLAPGDAPWAGNPAFTRKEACDAARDPSRRVPMTKAIADGIAAAVVKGEKPQAIAEQFGYRNGAASAAARSPAVVQQIRKILNQKGLTLEDEVNALKELHGATKLVSQRTLDVDGKVTFEEKERPDNGIRIKAVEMGFDLHGAFPHKRIQGGGDSGPKMVINLGGTFQNVFFGQVTREDGTVIEVEAEAQD